MVPVLGWDRPVSMKLKCRGEISASSANCIWLSRRRSRRTARTVARAPGRRLGGGRGGHGPAGQQNIPPQQVLPPGEGKSTTRRRGSGKSEHPAGDIQQAAGELLSTIPPGLYQAVHDVNTVLPTIAALLLDPGETYRDQQLAIIRDNDSLFDTQEVLNHWATVSNLTDRLRLPLIELAMPAVRRLTWQRQADFLQLVEALITIDNTINSFEYLLSRLLLQIIRESSRPRRRIKSQRSTKLNRYEYELGVVFSVLAQEGHTDRSDAMRAYRAGMNHLSSHHAWPSYHVPSDWPIALDSALQSLDVLRPLVKEELLESLKATVRFDGIQRASEAELLRVIAALLHVSLPLDYVPEVD